VEAKSLTKSAKSIYKTSVKHQKKIQSITSKMLSHKKSSKTEQTELEAEIAKVKAGNRMDKVMKKANGLATADLHPTSKTTAKGKPSTHTTQKPRKNGASSRKPSKPSKALAVNAKEKADEAKAKVKEAHALRKTARKKRKKLGKHIPRSIRKGGLATLKQPSKAVSKSLKKLVPGHKTKQGGNVSRRRRKGNRKLRKAFEVIDRAMKKRVPCKKKGDRKKSRRQFKADAMIQASKPSKGKKS